jgi:hypothetical protein
MIVVGIDGGCGTTAAVKIKCHGPDKLPEVLEKVYLPNMEMLDWLWHLECDLVVIEAIMSYGGAGSEVLQTAYWNGRFKTTLQCSGKAVCALERIKVKQLLFGKATGNDSTVTKHIEDLYGGRQVARGTKAKPGPLYGITKHMWQALGCAFACIAAIDSGTPEEWYWDELYTEKEAFREKKAERQEKRAKSTKRKSEKGRVGGKLEEALQERLNKKEENMPVFERLRQEYKELTGKEINDTVDMMIECLNGPEDYTWKLQDGMEILVRK